MGRRATSPARSTRPTTTSTACPAGIDPQRPVAVICGSGQRAASAASLLRRHGAREVIHVVDGGVPRLHRGPLSGAVRLQPLLLEVERHAHDAVLLALVRRRVALAGRGAQLAADVVEATPSGRISPSGARMNARAPMFFGSSWTQTISLEVRVARDQLAQLVLGERVEQLDARDRDVARRRALLVAGEVVVDLARCRAPAA